MDKSRNEPAAEVQSRQKPPLRDFLNAAFLIVDDAQQREIPFQGRVNEEFVCR